MKFVVGDVHGEVTKLKQLIKNIERISSRPEFIFIGDYIDKGESSKKTLEFLLDLNIRYKCVFLEGNHEYMWSNLSKENKIDEYLLKYGGSLTVNSFSQFHTLYQVQNILLNDYKSFFENLIPFWENDNFVITHSGIPPHCYDKRLEDIDKKDMLFNRYDFIKNKSKYKNKVVVFGHTGFYSPFYDGVKIGIDTSACYLKEQPISAFCLDYKFFINSNNSRLKLDEIDKNNCPNIVRVKPWRI
jgi:serine/threonine protein phosphatase 1